MPDWFFTIFRYKDKKSPDKLGKFPQDVHISSFPERRYLWTSRVLVGFSVFSICLTIMLASTIYLILPQRGALPSLYKHLPDNSSLAPLQADVVSVSAISLITENIIRRYISLRHEFPKRYMEITNKWSKNSEFKQISDDKVYLKFIEKMTMTKISEMMSIGLVRNVEIEQVSPLNDNFWMAKFVTHTSTTKYPKPIKAYWRAHIRITQEKLSEKIDEYIHNPLGIKIIHYSVAYLGGDDKNQSYLVRAKKKAENE